MPCTDCDGSIVVPAEFAATLAGLVAPRQRVKKGVTGWGSKVVLKYNPTEAEKTLGYSQQQSLVDWSTEDGLPRDVTIEVGRLVAGSGGTFPAGSNAVGLVYTYRFFAQIILGMGSVMSDPFFVDINRGQRFVASASYVSVTAFAAAPVTGTVAGSMQVMAGIGTGNAPSSAPVIYTQFIDNLVVNGSSAIVIPSRCNQLLPVQASNVNGVMQLDFRDPAGRTINSLQFGTGQQVLPIPLMEDYYDVLVTNQGLLTANFRLPFQVGV